MRRWFVADMTILLALSVFQTIVNASLPPTSEAVPLLGIYALDVYAFVLRTVLYARYASL